MDEDERLQPPTLNIFKATAELMSDLPVESIGVVMADALVYYLFGKVEQPMSKKDIEVLVLKQVITGLDVDAENYTKHRQKLHDRGVRAANARYHKDDDED